VVVNPATYDLVVDYGDIVLWDGSPVGWREHGGNRYPRFPLLECLTRAPLHRWWFLARQPEAGAVVALAKELGEDIVIEVRSEEEGFANGKFIVPHDRDLRAFANHLDALCARDGITLAMPALATVMGDRERSRDEDRRWRTLLDERRELLEGGVYRVLRDDRRREGLSGMYNGGLAALAISILLLTTMDGNALAIVLSLLSFPIAITIGSRVGRRRAATYICSHADCGCELPADAERCPRCSSKVLGTSEMTRDELLLEKRYEGYEEDESDSL
jgi:ribosomal protein L40E